MNVLPGLAVGVALAWTLAGGQPSRAEQAACQIAPLPVAPQATTAFSDEHAAYQYAVSIRSTTASVEACLGSAADEPRYSIFAARGAEAFVGVPFQAAGKTDPELPSQLSCELQVISLVDDVAHVRLTVRFVADANRDPVTGSWNQQEWTVNRDVRLDTTDMVQLTAPQGTDAPEFVVRYRVGQFGG